MIKEKIVLCDFGDRDSGVFILYSGLPQVGKQSLASKWVSELVMILSYNLENTAHLFEEVLQKIKTIPRDELAICPVCNMLSPCNSWDRPQQFPVTLTSGINRYRK